jgi:hypothetical protein
MVDAIIGMGGQKINDIRQMSGSVIKINEPQDTTRFESRVRKRVGVYRREFDRKLKQKKMPDPTSQHNEYKRQPSGQAARQHLYCPLSPGLTLVLHQSKQH